MSFQPKVNNIDGTWYWTFITTNVRAQFYFTSPIDWSWAWQKCFTVCQDDLLPAASDNDNNAHLELLIGNGNLWLRTTSL